MTRLEQNPPLLPERVQSVRIYRFDYVVGRPSERPKLYSYQEFDPAGHLIERVQYGLDTGVVTRWQFEYDDQQLLHLERRSDAMGQTHETIRYIYTHDEVGRLQELVELGQEGERRRIKFHYTEDKSHTELITVQGVPSETKTFDSHGKLIEDYHEGTGIATSYAYDSHGNLDTIRESHEEGHVEHRYDNHYDQQGHLVKVIRNGILEVTYEYGAVGVLNQEIRYDTDWQPTEKFLYEYTYYPEAGSAEERPPVKGDGGKKTGVTQRRRSGL